MAYVINLVDIEQRDWSEVHDVGETSLLCRSPHGVGLRLVENKVLKQTLLGIACA